MSQPKTPDVCLILEGTFPYITGGVSTWTHDLIRAHEDLSFYLITLVAEQGDLVHRYEIPQNVVGLDTISLQVLPPGSARPEETRDLLSALKGPLHTMQTGGGLRELQQILEVLGPDRERLGAEVLLNSKEAWELLLQMYQEAWSEGSFLDFFWGWRTLCSGLFSVLLAPLPAARVYHTVCTGYAGLLAARATLETGRPALLTEHGIYTNERRIEVAMADWIHDGQREGLTIEKSRSDIGDLYVDTFTSYSRSCYQAARTIITLYEGNQKLQLEEGAASDQLRVIPNGIDWERYSRIERSEENRPPTVAFIGRVVPIKDVKTYIRACAILRGLVANFRALILGPTDEDKDYLQECRSMVRHVGLEEILIFKGKVDLRDYLGRIDVVVLTSISEAQPLVILEAGAVGVPTVACDVGACRDMILGAPGENPKLGPGGAITPLSNPTATAKELHRLLTDPQWHRQCSEAIRERVQRSYNKNDLDRAYHDLYTRSIVEPTRSVSKEDESKWPVLASPSAS